MNGKFIAETRIRVLLICVFAIIWICVRGAFAPDVLGDTDTSVWDAQSFGTHVVFEVGADNDGNPDTDDAKELNNLIAQSGTTPTEIAISGSAVSVTSIIMIPSGKTIKLTGYEGSNITLDANGACGVTEVNQGTLYLENVTITGGKRDYGGGVYVRSEGTLVTSGGAISDNSSVSGGAGVYVDRDSTFTMYGGAISDNTANSEGGGGVGGGVYMRDSTFTMYDGAISDNTANSNGGGVYNDGTFTMYDGAISDNTANNGGGVYNDGTFTMNDGAISDNTANSSGGGVRMYDGTFTMNGGAISDNTATYDGGGVSVYYDSTFTMYGGAISDNTAGEGGGVYVDNGGTFMMNDGAISDNTANSEGGGVSAFNGTFTMNGGEISGNNAGKGGGAAVNGLNLLTPSAFIINSGAISDNTATNGGGISLAGPGTFIINGCKISDNTATNGGGIYAARAFTLGDCEISNNEAVAGGGIGCPQDKLGNKITITGNTRFFGNTASAAYKLTDGDKETLAQAVFEGVGNITEISVQGLNEANGFPAETPEDTLYANKRSVFNNYDIKYIPPTYTVTYLGLSGAYFGDSTANPNPKSYRGGDTAAGNVPVQNPEKEHYNFLGWTAENEGQTVGTGDPETVLSIDMSGFGRITLTAVWEAETHTMTFDKNGGATDSDPTFKSVAYGQPTGALPGIGGEPGAPGRPGYEFIGWGTQSGESNAPDINAEDTANFGEDVTVYAVWSALEDNELFFDKNAQDAESGTETRRLVKGGEAVGPLPAHGGAGAPARKGYILVGWSEGAGPDNEPNFTGDRIADFDDMTVYAVWEAKIHIVTFDANGGTTADGDRKRTVIPPQTKLDGADGANNRMPQNPVRGGHTFDGWSTTRDGEDGTPFTDDTEVDADVTVYAKWLPVQSGDTGSTGGTGSTPGTSGAEAKNEENAVSEDDKDDKGDGDTNDDDDVRTEKETTPGGTDPVVRPHPVGENGSLTPIAGETNAFVETSKDGVPLGEWHYDDGQGEWVFTEYTHPGDLPQTGGIPENRTSAQVCLAMFFLLVCFATVISGGAARRRRT
jgi:uncharacterized repeat protein (TIGR02543 family)